MRWDESVRASRTLGRPPHAQHAIAAISEGEAWWTIMASKSVHGNNTHRVPNSLSFNFEMKFKDGQCRR